MIEPHEPAVEPDHLPGRTIAALAATTVATILACSVVVWLVAGRQLTGGGERAPQLRMPAEVDAIETRPFSGVLDAERTRAVQRARVDRVIGPAIDRYLAAHGAADHAGGPR